MSDRQKTPKRIAFCDVYMYCSIWYSNDKRFDCATVLWPQPQPLSLLKICQLLVPQSFSEGVCPVHLLISVKLKKISRHRIKHQFNATNYLHDYLLFAPQ